MKKVWTWLPLFLFFLAGGFVFVGQRLGGTRVIAAGFLCLGLAAVIAGLEFIRSKQAFFLPSSRTGRRRSESFSGLPAQLWGVVFVLAGLGVGLAAMAAIMAPEAARAWLEQAMDTAAGWGLLSLILGVFLGLYGLIRLLGGSGWAQSGLYSRAANVGYRGMGGLFLVLSLLLVGVGLLLLLSPDTLLGWVEQTIPLPR